jgi:NADH:ubiquinone oxidoreductase subunit K
VDARSQDRREEAVRAERSDAGHPAGRGYPSPRAGGSAPRGRAADRPDLPDLPVRAPERRGPDPRAARNAPRNSGEIRRPVAADQRAGSSAAGRTRAPAAAGPGLKGAVAVLGIFLLTLAAAAADSYIGLGLGTITLGALTAGTVAAVLLVRRRDLLSVVVAPPLVFVAVAFLNIALAPSATLSLPTLATLLVRGFPAMGLATGAAIVLALFRTLSRR